MAKKNKSKRLTVDKVHELFSVAENWADLRQIMVNVAYYSGHQWIGWNRAERRIQALPVEPGVQRITLNKIRPRVTTLLSKHIKNKIKFDVVPATKEQEDIDTARAADRYLDYMWEELGFTQKTKDIFLNMLIKKRCWVKTWFDAEAGQDITPDPDDPGYDEWMESGEESVHTGEIRAKVCDPLTIFADPGATCEEEIRWIIERYAKDVDEIEAEYGKKVSPDANLDYLSNYDVTKVGSDGISSYQVQRKQNMALVYELWYKPSKTYPNGAKITVCDGVELDYDDNSGELPYQLFGYIPVPGSLLYDALVTDMIPVQRGINEKRTMIATHAKRLGNSMWLNPLGNGVDDEDLTNETGGVVHYTPMNNMKPERIVAPDIPSFYDRDLSQDAIDLDDMSGAREVSQGRMPAGLDTLGGLEIMVEQENEKLTIAAQNYEQGMKEVMRRILRLIKQHYTEERQGRILGEDNEVEIISFNGSDLTGHEDINVVQGSSLPEMKAAQQERIMLMWDKGAIVKRDGTPDHHKLLRLMGMGDSTELFEQHQLDENNAKLENMEFEELVDRPDVVMAFQEYQQALQVAEQAAAEAGVPLESIIDQIDLPPIPEGIPQTWDSDDDEIHIHNHNTFRKQGVYRQLPAEIRAIVDWHYQQHVDRVQAPQIQQQQQEQQEAEANRQHQQEMKLMDQNTKLQTELLKSGRG